MNTPVLASIIICNYNYDRFLNVAIDSALNQTYRPLEVIVVDDGSTDDSRTIIAEYGDRIVPILKDNGGHDTAINAGFEASAGGVVCFLDADDALFPTAIERAAEALADPGVSKVHWPLSIVDERGLATGRLLPAETLPHGDLRAEVIVEGPQSYLTPPTSGNAWARRFLERVCPIQPLENRAGTADDQLSMLAPLFGRVAAIECQGVFRAHGSNNYWGRALDELAMTVRDYDRYCDILGAACRARGIVADPAQWRSRSWFHRLHEALQPIVAAVPEGQTFILADEDRWGAGEWIQGRRKVPFPNRDGVYWGKPAGDEEAIEELDRLRAEGASFLAIGWPAFWYRDWLPKWHHYVRTSFHCVVETALVDVYDLRPAAGAVRPDGPDDA